MKNLSSLIILLLISALVQAQTIANTTWKTYNPNLTDTVTVRITNDSILQTDGSNNLLLSSLYSQSNDTVQLVDVGGTYMCLNPDTGTYNFSITGDTMLITLISDDCFPRSITFDGVKLWRVGVPSAVKDFENSDISFNLYPNPSHGFVNIKLIEPGTLSIFNELGQILVQKEFIEPTTSFTINLNKGYYLVRFRSGQQIQHKKLLIE